MARAARLALPFRGLYNKRKRGAGMHKNLLPIGSVVLLRGGEKRLMICGRIQTRAGSDKVYD